MKALALAVRDIFWALDGLPMPTPQNALIWWRRRRNR